MKLKTMAATAAVLLPAMGALAVENVTDLTAVGTGVPQTVIADFGGNGLVENFESHPSGTGVFDPFLTLERNASGGHPAGIEGAYNTDGHTDTDSSPTSSAPSGTRTFAWATSRS